ncbi:MAG: hypothetical protein IJD35_00200 [Clostridia bacterium]|nr:hypothetical protein [Clostridia bacterium]
MKKLFVVLLIAIFILALAACGGEASSTTQGADTTTPAVTTPAVTTPMTTTAVEITTTAPMTTQVKTPETTLPGIDILYGDEADRAIDPDWNEGHSIAFKNTDAALDFNMVLMIKMVESKNPIYEELVITDFDSPLDDTLYEGRINPKYRFVVTVDGQDIEIERFLVLSQTQGGSIRMDLGEDFVYPVDWNQKGGIDVRLRIYDVSTDEVVYYAWFTDPRYDDLYYFAPPEHPPIIFTSSTVE